MGLRLRSGPSVELMRLEGWDVWSVFESARNIRDVEILSLAAREQRWVLTFDLDYGDLIFNHRCPPPPALVQFRLVDYLPREPAQRALQILGSAQAKDGGYFVVLPKGQRWRPFQLKAGERV